jgi:hypothetical protein
VRRLYDELTLIRKIAGRGRRSRSCLTQEVWLRLLEARHRGVMTTRRHAARLEQWLEAKPSASSGASKRVGIASKPRCDVRVDDAPTAVRRCPELLWAGFKNRDPDGLRSPTRLDIKRGPSDEQAGSRQSLDHRDP